MTADQAAKLGQTLTPVGAEQAGNADGTIPAWTGGMSTLGPEFKDYKAGQYYPDPFPQDKPLLFSEFGEAHPPLRMAWHTNFAWSVEIPTPVARSDLKAVLSETKEAHVAS